MPTKILKPYDDRPRVKTVPVGKTRAKQSFADECDINNIMSKYQKTGAITHANKHQPSYGFASSITFNEAMTVVAKANSMFEDLPSSLRERFENDPAKYLDFVQDPDNSKEMAELGLLVDNPTPEADPSPAEPAAPAASPAVNPPPTPANPE